MKKKSMKNKVIAGIIAVGLISSSGFAFANTNAGEALKNWYDNLFNRAVAESEDDVEDYGEGLISEFNEDLDGLKDETAASILDKRDNETESSLSEIEKAKQAYLEELIEEHGEIKGYMEQQFFEVYMDNWLEIQTMSGELTANAGAELETLAGETGEESVQHVTTELTSAKDDAVQELEDEIEKAKKELAEGIDFHSDNLTDNLTKEIDFSIQTVKEVVDDLKVELIEEQQTIIAATAEELEQDAKDSLDDVVSDMNN